MTTCMEPELKGEKAVSFGDVTGKTQKEQAADFSCPECKGPVLWFLDLWMCMACHKRRIEQQVQTGRTLLGKFEISRIHEHSDDNPI